MACTLVAANGRLLATCEIRFGSMCLSLMELRRNVKSLHPVAQGDFGSVGIGRKTVVCTLGLAHAGRSRPSKCLCPCRRQCGTLSSRMRGCVPVRMVRIENPRWRVEPMTVEEVALSVLMGLDTLEWRKQRNAPLPF